MQSKELKKKEKKKRMVNITNAYTSRNRMLSIHQTIQIVL